MLIRRVRIILASIQGLLSLKAQRWDTSLTLPGCESLVREGSYVWAFSYDRRIATEDTNVEGHLYRFSGVDSFPFLREVTPMGKKWHPFGLAYLGGYLWFSHAPKGPPTEVWRFHWTGEKLEAPKVWRHRDFVSIQAVCPIDTTRFYVANDRKNAARWHLVAGFFIRRVRSSLILCESDTCRKVADRIPYAADVAYLPQIQWLFVSTAFRRALWVYQENGMPISLRYVRRIRLPGYPDNISVVGDSTLWVVCHKKLTAWARSLAFGGTRSRWLIAEVRILPEGQYRVRTLYRAPKGYATASIAIPMGDYIYVGSVFEPTLLRLKVSETIPPDAYLPSTISAFGSTTP
ncbi:MAG: hypothetical protein NZZ60_02485 [Bacteroidia bacterium]|nr:hypothetical protein [Bacteroidia bacterium]MCX7652214.1 hypothetical protein [Bacteroidia bacterium]MDW8416476.1 hypothetical protein [Bacteroidia bacterium]